MARIDDKVEAALLAMVEMYLEATEVAFEHRDRLDRLVNELVLLRAERDGAVSLLLEVQQECIVNRQWAEAALARCWELERQRDFYARHYHNSREDS